MWAAGSGHTESVRVLLEFGADASLVNLVCCRGGVPQSCSGEFLLSSCCHLLRVFYFHERHCCRLLRLVHFVLAFSDRIQQGRTALDYAHEGRKRELIAVLEDHARFLAQLGSHTKPAVRGHSQAQEEDAGPQEEASELVNVLDQQAFNHSFAQLVTRNF
eukprot:m.708665 g.708665  ORF g.708665 m.708665 type:complete len:160 (-) comp58746_c0_seq23:395-874(-)